MVKNNLNFNNDIKKKIFDYFEKKNKKKCLYCNKLCIWYKKYNDFIKTNKNSIICLECYPYPLVWVE
jgi:hypothetical protein